MSEQGSEEWLAERLGYATASNFHKILAKGGGKTRASYLQQLVVERLTGKPVDSYSNSHMARGNELEPMARMAYEAETGIIVEETGFISMVNEMVGGSPDGLIDVTGGVEIKSRLPGIQLETIKNGGYPAANKAQIQGLLWITGRSYWDYVSYSPDLPENLQLYIFRVVRDVDYIRNLQAETAVFLREVEAEEKKWRNHIIKHSLTTDMYDH